MSRFVDPNVNSTRSPKTADATPEQAPEPEPVGFDVNVSESALDGWWHSCDIEIKATLFNHFYESCSVEGDE